MNTNRRVVLLLLWRKIIDYRIRYFVGSLSVLCLLLPPVASLAENRLLDKDVSSQDSIIAALYEAVSEEKKTDSDWDRFRHLFAQDARLMVAAVSSDGVVDLKAWSPEQYVEYFGKALEGHSFYEAEVHRVSESFANIAHVFSTYEIRSSKEDKVVALRGLSSIQLFYDNKRWWIISVFWQGASSSNPLPERYLDDK